MAGINIGPVIGIEGEASYRTAIRGLVSATRELASEMKLVTSEFDKNSKSQESLTAKGKVLESEIDAQKRLISEQSDMLAKCSDKYGDTSAKTQQWQTKVNESKAKLNDLNSELRTNSEKLEIASKGWYDLDQKLKTVSSSLTTAGSAMSSIGGTLTKSVTAPLAALGTAAVAAFNQVDEGSDTVIAATGAVGDQAAALDSVYRDVASSIKGSFSDIGGVVGEVSTRTGATGDDLEKLSEQYMKFADVTGTDATESVKLVSKAMGDASIPASETSSVLDALTAATQASGISLDTLTTNITKYGAPMRALGFDTQESIAIFSGWEKAGVNTETAMSGMKKAISNWSAEGKDSREEFKKTLQTIGECPDIASATSQAIEVFGQKAGPDLADAIQTGKFSYEDFMTILDSSGGTLDATYGEMQDGTDKIAVSWQQIKLAASDLGDAIGTTLAPIISSFAQKLSELGEWFSGLSDSQKDFIVKAGLTAAAVGPVTSAFGGLATKVGNLINPEGGFVKLAAKFAGLSGDAVTFGSAMTGAGSKLAAFATGPVGIAIAAVAGIALVLKECWDNSEIFRNSVSQAGQTISSAFGQAAAILQPALQPLIDIGQQLAAQINPAFQALGDFLGTYVIPCLGQFAAFLITELASAIAGALQFITGLIDGFKWISDGITTMVQLAGALFSGDWGAAFMLAQKAVTDFQAGFQAIWDGIVDFVNGIIPELGTTISDGFSSIFSGISEIGKNVVEGLWQGIEGSKDWLHEKLDQFTGWMPDWMKNALGIASPSKVIANEIGRYIPEGAWQGIQSAAPKLLSNINGLADSMVTAMTPDMSKMSIDGAQTGNGKSTEDVTGEFKTITDDTTAESDKMSSENQATYAALGVALSDATKTTGTEINTEWNNASNQMQNRTNALSSVVINTGNGMSSGFGSVLNQMSNTSVNQTAQMQSGMTAQMQQLPPNMNTVGQNAMTELKAGIDATKQSVLDGTSELVQQLLDTFITGLGIHSPSRKMQWIGEMMAAGLLKGLSSDQIGQYTLHIIDLMQDSFKSGKLDINAVLDSLGDNIPALVAKLGVDPESVTSFLYPLVGTEGVISSYFGYRDDTGGVGSTYHQGLDIAAATGTPIDAVMGGTVVIAGDYGGYGNAVMIDHGNGLQTLYGHMSSVGTSVGSQVSAGSVIGAVGSTGYSTGPHLHLSVIKDGVQVDPLPYVQGASVVSGNTLAGQLMSAYNARKYGTGTTYAGNGDVTSWITQALQITGMLTPANLANTVSLAMAESGGDPSAQNDWDSNAAAGNPSKGLMQTIQSTFDAYALPGHTNILNPVDNAIASIRYQIARYGYLRSAPGYAVGSSYVPYDTLAFIHEGEMITPAAQNPYSNSGGDYLEAIVDKVVNRLGNTGGLQVNQYINGNPDEYEIVRRLGNAYKRGRLIPR